MTSGRCLIPIVSTNSKFLIGRRCLPNRFQAERSFLKDQTFLLSSTCQRRYPTRRNGSTLVRASSSHVGTSFSAFLTAFSSQSSRFTGTAMSRTPRSSHPFTHSLFQFLHLNIPTPFTVYLQVNISALMLLCAIS